MRPTEKEGETMGLNREETSIGLDFSPFLLLVVAALTVLIEAP